MRMTVCVAMALVAVAACSPRGANSTAGVDRDTLTRRQKDSIFAASKVPNAKAVGRALNAADAETSHNAAIDSANAEASR